MKGGKLVLCCAFWMGAMVAAWAQLDPQGAYKKKYVAFGFESAYLTPQDYIDHVAEFEKSPLDGVNVHILGNAEKGRPYQAFRTIVGKPALSKESLSDMVEPLRKMTAYPCFRESFLSGWYPPKKRIAWDDDATWAVVSNNLANVAWLAKAGNMRGMAWDVEDYTGQKQFFRVPGDPDYKTLVNLARRRGREIFGGIFAEYPEITMFMFWICSNATYRHIETDPLGILCDRGDLWWAFVNGILDVIPPTATLVDGDEDGYRREAAKGDYLVNYTRVFNWDLPLIVPENRVKYLSQVSPSVGQYVDMFYGQDDPKSDWYFGPVDGSRLNHLVRNVRQATSGSQKYVWFWSECGGWAHWSKELRADPERLNRKVKYVWDDVLPGINIRLKAVKDPGGFLAPRLNRLIAEGKLKDVFGGKPYGTWKADAPKGKDGKAPPAPGELKVGENGDMRAQGVLYSGCFLQVMENVKPGTIYYVKGRVRGPYARVNVDFKNDQGRYFYEPKVQITPRKAGADGWREVVGFFEVHPQARSVQIALGISGQSPDDVAEFRDFGVYNVSACKEWLK